MLNFSQNYKKILFIGFRATLKFWKFKIKTYTTHNPILSSDVRLLCSTKINFVHKLTTEVNLPLSTSSRKITNYFTCRLRYKLILLPCCLSLSREMTEVFTLQFFPLICYFIEACDGLADRKVLLILRTLLLYVVKL